MEYRWLEDIDDFRKAAEEWDRALIGSGNNNPFLLSRFIIDWWEYFGKGLRPAIFIAYEGKRITAGLPLYSKRSGAKGSFAEVLSYIGGSAANYTEPLYGSEASLLPILKDGLAERKGWDILYLSDIRPGNRFLCECENAGTDNRFILMIEQDHFNWAIDLSEGRNAFLSKVSKKLRRDLKAKRRRVEGELGKLELREINGEAEVKRYFDIYASFSLKAFRERQRESNFENERYLSFFKEFLSYMAATGRLDAHALFAGDKLLAISFGYKFGKGFNWALTGFNYDYRYFRPGYLLIEELIEEVSRRGEVYYNWYGYERFYKGQWCNSKTPLFRIILSRKSLKARSFLALKNVKVFVNRTRQVLNRDKA